MQGEHDKRTALTEARLRGAAKRAVAAGHAVAAVLFGSRARATATPESDWDVCLVTDDEDARGETERTEALEADGAPWNDPRVQTLWRARRAFDRGVNAGSVEEAIAREGKVLAGAGAIVTGARVKPFRASAVARHLLLARANLEAGISIAHVHACEPSEETRRNAALTMSLDAIAAVTALGCALCTLTATPPAGIHDVAVNGRRMQALGEAAGDAAWGALLVAIGARLIAIDRGGARLRHGEQGGAPRESYEDAALRLALALETDVWIRSGLVEGEGPWAALAQHPQGAALRKAMAHETAAAAEAAEAERREAPVALCSDTLRRAVSAWYEANARRAAHTDGARR